MKESSNQGTNPGHQHARMLCAITSNKPVNKQTKQKAPPPSPSSEPRSSHRRHPLQREQDRLPREDVPRSSISSAAATSFGRFAAASVSSVVWFSPSAAHQTAAVWPPEPRSEHLLHSSVVQETFQPSGSLDSDVGPCWSEVESKSLLLSAVKWSKLSRRPPRPSYLLSFNSNKPTDIFADRCRVFVLFLIRMSHFLFKIRHPLRKWLLFRQCLLLSSTFSLEMNICQDVFFAWNMTFPSENLLETSDECLKTRFVIRNKRFLRCWIFLVKLC